MARTTKMNEFVLPQEAICVYPWDSLPSMIKNLSEHGGDEDWAVVATMPAYYKECRHVADRLCPHGNKQEVDMETPDGKPWLLIITAHA